MQQAATIAPRFLDGEHQIVKRLREIDPKAELVQIAAGWLLGVKAENAHAKRLAAKELRRVTKSDGFEATDPLAAERLFLLNLYASGFRPIALYEQQQPDQRIVDDFRVRDFNWKYRQRETEARKVREMMQDEFTEQRKAMMRDMVEAEFPSIHRFAMRGQTSFTRRARRLLSSARSLIRRIGGSK